VLEIRGVGSDRSHLSQAGMANPGLMNPRTERWNSSIEHDSRIFNLNFLSSSHLKSFQLEALDG